MPSLRARRVAVTGGFFAYAAMPGVWAARIPTVQDERNLSVGVLGACLLTPAIGAVAALPAAGASVSRWGRRQVMVAAAVVMALSLPLLAAAPGISGFVFALAVFGASGAVLDVALNVEAVAVESSYGRSLLTGMHGAWSLGAFAGTGIGVASAAAHVRPLAAFVVTAVAALVALLVCARKVADARSESAAAAPVFALPSRRTIRLGLLVFCSLFVEAAAADWSAVFLHRSVGLSVAAAGFGFGVFSVSMVTGRLLGDRLVDRVGPVQTVRWPAIVGAIGLAVGVATRSAVPALLGFLLAGAGTAVLFPLAMTAAGADAVDSARAIAAAATVGYLGWVLAPGVIGGIASALSLPVAVGSAAVFLALAAALSGTLRSVPDPDDEQSDVVLGPARDQV